MSSLLNQVVRKHAFSMSRFIASCMQDDPAAVVLRLCQVERDLTSSERTDNRHEAQDLREKRLDLSY